MLFQGLARWETRLLSPVVMLTAGANTAAFSTLGNTAIHISGFSRVHGAGCKHTHGDLPTPGCETASDRNQAGGLSIDRDTGWAIRVPCAYNVHIPPLV